MIKKFLSAAICLLCVVAVNAKEKGINFDDYFSANTLRVDYMFTGDANHQNIVLDRLSSIDLWAGRRNKLDQMPLLGNGQVVMKDAATGKIIYQTSFSSLFMEWLTTDEANTTPRSFEHTVLMPMPKAPVEITATLTNMSAKVIAKYVHKVDPKDILIHHLTRNPELDYTYIHKGGSVDKCVDVAILGEGYTLKERDTFYADAAVAMDALFSHEPFKSRKSEFNIVAVFTPSEDSGVSVPRLGQWKKTAFNSHFSTFYSDRYLTTPDVNAIHDAIAGVLYEHLIILANTDEYGGGGIYNSYTLTTAHHPDFRPVVVHEFGHSFGGLADEYTYGDENYYPRDVEPWELNITSMVDFDKKWKDMLPKGTKIPTPETDENMNKVGVFEGAGYTTKGMYRPAYNCRMRTNIPPHFCPVCQRALNYIIDFYTK